MQGKGLGSERLCTGQGSRAVSSVSPFGLFRLEIMKPANQERLFFFSLETLLPHVLICLALLQIWALGHRGIWCHCTCIKVIDV